MPETCKDEGGGTVRHVRTHLAQLLLLFGVNTREGLPQRENLRHCGSCTERDAHNASDNAVDRLT